MLRLPLPSFDFFSARHVAAVAALAFALAAMPAHATWSIVAVDPATGEVGAAAATCTVGVELILAIAPGKGVIVAQAATNLSARDEGVRLIEAGETGEDVIAAIANEDFNPGGLMNAPWTEQQYGVATLVDAHAVAFTGDETPDWHGSVSAGSVSAQGNTLRSESVITEALAAFQASDGPMAERLIAGLEAGAAEGGDARCDEARGSLSAFVAVAEPDDPPGKPALFIVAPRRFGLLGAAWNMLFPYHAPESDPPATVRLRQMYEERRE